MKDKFNNMLNKIEVTKELDERVLNNTIYKKKNNNIFRSMQN